jgi:hypothetical protein
LKAVPISKQATKNGSDHVRSGLLLISTSPIDFLVAYPLTLLLIGSQPGICMEVTLTLPQT